MKKEKRMIFIEAATGKEFEEKMNDTLKGLPDPEVQIFGKFEGCIIYTEHIYEEEKTIAQLFEEAGCGAKCEDCPYYERPTDGRVKWTVCHGRKVKADSRACDSYYLERRNNVSVIGRKTEGAGLEDRGHGCSVEDITMEGISQEERRHTLFAIGEGDPVKVYEGPGRRIIQGGMRNGYGDLNGIMENDVVLRHDIRSADSRSNSGGSLW